MTSTASESLERRAGLGAFAGGMGIGTLGGLIGLGGAEFRLPLLIGMFRFGPLEAVIVNKAMSLIVIATALPLRTSTISFAAIADQWTVIVNLLAGTYWAPGSVHRGRSGLGPKRSIALSPCCLWQSPRC